MKLFFILTILSVFTYYQKAYGQTNFGIGTTILTEDTNLGINGKIFYRTTEKITAVATMTYYLRSNAHFSFDADAHVDLIENDNFSISPLIGFNIRKTSNYGTSMNLGLFCLFPSSVSKVYFEPKLIVDNNTILVLSAGFFF